MAELFWDRRRKAACDGRYMDHDEMIRELI